MFESLFGLDSVYMGEVMSIISEAMTSSSRIFSKQIVWFHNEL